MSGYLGVDGPTCQGCGKDEAFCARNDHSCCGACTHTFDGGESRRYLCFGCNRVHWSSNPSGPLPKRCRACREREHYERNREQIAAEREGVA